MRIVESSPGFWFLLDDHGKFYMEIQYEIKNERIFILMELNTAEDMAYRELGRTYLALLAQQVPLAHPAFVSRNMLVSTEVSSLGINQKRKRPRTRSPKLKASVPCPINMGHGMHVIECNVDNWFLLAEGNNLYLNVKYELNKEPVSLLFELDNGECQSYRQLGQDYMMFFAEKVPRWPVIYLRRDLSDSMHRLSTAAIEAWRQSRQHIDIG